MNKTLLALACFMATSALADTTQTVTIDGQATGKAVTMLTFNGDNVTLTFDDATTTEADMSLVAITLDYSTTTPDVPNCIQGVAETTPAASRIYTLSGQFVGTSTDGLAKGIYIVGGKKMVIK